MSFDADQDRFAYDESPPCLWTRTRARRDLADVEAAMAMFLSAARALAEAANRHGLLETWEIASRDYTAKPEEVIQGFLERCEAIARDEGDLLSVQKFEELQALAEGKQ